MASGTVVSTAGGNILMTASQGIEVSQLVAGTGEVGLVAGESIVDAQNDTVSVDANGFSLPDGDPRVVNVQASGLLLQAGGSIGTAGNPLDTNVGTLAVQAESMFMFSNPAM